jgi:hypothetical protein
MPSPIGTNAEIVVQGTVPTSGGGAKTLVNVFHYVCTGVPAATELQVWTAFAAAVWANIAAQLSVDWVGQQSSVRFMDDSNRPPVITTPPASGGVALPRLPANLAAVLYLKTALRGKSYRGFKHFSPLPTASVIKDEINPGVLGAINAVLATVTGAIAPAAGPTYVPAIFSRTKSPSLVNPTNLVLTPVTSGRVNKTIGNMRHRKEKTNF